MNLETEVIAPSSNSINTSVDIFNSISANASEIYT